jgi:hypothetical protein
MFSKDYSSIKFENNYNARTLPPEYIVGPNIKGISQEYYGRLHSSGWFIFGQLSVDYHHWVNEFIAYHPTYGYVMGDFEERVKALNECALNKFLQDHPYEEWDYDDI